MKYQLKLNHKVAEGEKSTAINNVFGVSDKFAAKAFKVQEAEIKRNSKRISDHEALLSVQTSKLIEAMVNKSQPSNLEEFALVCFQAGKFYEKHSGGHGRGGLNDLASLALLAEMLGSHHH